MPPTGAALVTDVGFITNGSTTVFGAATAGSGSQFSVRNFPFSAQAHLVDAWYNGATKGAIRIRSPKLSDNVQGIRVNVAAGLNGFLLPRTVQQLLVPQDTLIVEGLGGAAETDTYVIQTYYDNLSGAAPQLKMPGDIAGSFQYITTWEVATTASATIGNFGLTGITSLYDESQANQWYAILGYTTDTAITAVGVTGNDLSSLNIAGPGDVTPWRTRRYFWDLSNDLGKACIPCINAANKASTNVITADKAASTTANVSLTVAVMPTGWQP